MHALLPVTPALTIVLLTLLTAMPLGIKLPPGLGYLLPMIPYAAIHYWVVRRPRLVPEWLAFLAGFITDVLTFGPLGYWALVYLIGYVAALLLRGEGEKGAIAGWVEFAATLLLLAAAQWLISSAYLLSPSDWRPIVFATLIVVAGYPALALLLMPLDRLWGRRSNDSLARGI